MTARHPESSGLYARKELLPPEPENRECLRRVKDAGRDFRLLHHQQDLHANVSVSRSRDGFNRSTGIHFIHEERSTHRIREKRRLDKFNTICR